VYIGARTHPTAILTGAIEAGMTSLPSAIDAEHRARRIGVLVVDDHDLFRTGISGLLASEADIEVLAQASSGRAGVRLARELRPDVVLMDLSMPDIDGVAATRQILADVPGVAVIVLTVLSGQEHVRAAIQAGASGFVAKETSIDSVVSAVRTAAQGAAWLSPQAADVILGRIRRDVDRPGAHASSEELTAREIEVLRLIARGMENPQIAAHLGISTRTAKNHVSSILAKLGILSRVEAAVYAVRSGLA
jgi:DNA-binding NarL/FixJ family response regulator